MQMTKLNSPIELLVNKKVVVCFTEEELRSAFNEIDKQRILTTKKDF